MSQFTKAERAKLNRVVDRYLKSQLPAQTRLAKRLAKLISAGHK